jgi:transposase
VSAIYNISKSSLHRWVSRDPNVGNARRRRRSIFLRVESIVKDEIKTNPFITLHDLSRIISRECNITTSRQTLGRCRHRCGIRRKKVSRVVDVSTDTAHATRVDEFCKEHVQKSDVNHNIVCIDEAGFIVGDHNRYGYISRGQRLNILSGRSLRRSKLTLLLAISEHGIIDYQILSHNCKKADFVKFISELIIPEGTSLLMDNVPFHHSKETKEAVNNLGCHQLFIPPYSPKFNAIENVFGVLKSKYRAQCPLAPSLQFDYSRLMESVLQDIMDTDFTRYFNRALQYSIRHVQGHHPSSNYEY